MFVLGITDLHTYIAIVPFVGALALREWWTRARDRDLREREERVHAAHREAMRALQAAMEAEHAAQRTREEFLARMSHELRTPLNAVIGLSRVLEKNRPGNQSPRDLHLLSRVRAGGEALLRLVDDVLEQSRIESGQLSLEIVDADITPVVARVVSSFQWAAAAKGIRLDCELAPDAHSVGLDVGRFEQVLQHLVDNAVKFTVNGGVHVGIDIDADTGRPARVAVTDTGIGIPGDQIERVFLPFEQVDGSSRRAHAGAGLGLPLARRLCEAMGCRLTAESEVGRGSRFTIHMQPPT